MKTYFPLPSLGLGAGLVLALIASAPSARANVYATDIKVNGQLFAATNSAGVPVAISYRLNQAADLGVTVNILSGTNVAASIAGGTNMGLNTVSWTPANTGAYAVSITAAAKGFQNWTQISIDTNAGMAAFYPWGIDVDKNTNSAYYGRVVMTCSVSGNGTGAQRDGLFKMNADGSQADEGWFGTANYLNDDGGDAPTAGQMPNSFGFNPGLIRIGDDDRIYWCDNSSFGAVVACDILATTNQMVINESGYANNPEMGYLINNGGDGVQQFDVSGATSSNAAVYLVDTGDLPNWGVWMWRLTNGAADPADTTGTQAVATGGNLKFVTGAGISVDNNLDLFVSQSRQGSGDTNNRTFEFLNWNGGALPPEAGGTNYAKVVGSAWAVGANDNYQTAIWDTIIDSRVHPTTVAIAMANGAPVSGGYLGANGGIRLLNATNGSIVMTNLDLANWYNGAAFDAVGNVYGCSRTTNLWRVWSPPGASTNTTAAVAQIVVPALFNITSITATAADGGCYAVTINFSADASLTASAFTLLSSGSVNGPYTATGGASVTGSGGQYQATATICSGAQYFELSHN